MSDPGRNRTCTFLDVGQVSSPLDHGIMVAEAGCFTDQLQVAGPGVAPGSPGL